MKKILTFILLLFILSSSFVFANNSTDLKTSLEKLKKEYNNLSLAFKNLKQQYSNLELKYNKTQKMYNDLKKNYETLLKNYNNLKANYSNLNKNFTAIVSENKKLKSQISANLNTINGLKASLPIEKNYDVVKDNITLVEKAPFLFYKNKRYVAFEPIVTAFLNVRRSDYVFDEVNNKCNILTYVSKKDETWLTDLEITTKTGGATEFGFNNPTLCVNYQKFFKNIYWKHTTSNVPFTVDYNLNSNYTKFCCFVGISDNSTDGSKGMLRVYADGKLLGEYLLEMNKNAILVELNVKGKKTLSLQFEKVSSNIPGFTCIVVGDPVLVP